MSVSSAARGPFLDGHCITSRSFTVPSLRGRGNQGRAGVFLPDAVPGVQRAQRAGDPPVGPAEQPHRGRHQQHPDDGGVHEQRHDHPDAEDIDPGLRDQLAGFREALGADIPLGAVLAFLRCWTLLYGAVSMEVFGHMSFALTDPAPMFEITLGDLAALVGLRYPPRP
jgi:hypothetical protein